MVPAWWRLRLTHAAVFYVAPRLQTVAEPVTPRRLLLVSMHFTTALFGLWLRRTDYWKEVMRPDVVEVMRLQRKIS